MHYVYALYNRNSDKIYIGQTEDLGARLKLHKDKTFANSYTSKNDGNWDLVYSEVISQQKRCFKKRKTIEKL